MEGGGPRIEDGESLSIHDQRSTTLARPWSPLPRQFIRHPFIRQETVERDPVGVEDVALVVDRGGAALEADPGSLRTVAAEQSLPAQPGAKWTENDLYIRISLTTPDGKQPILLPAVFPPVAPAVPPRPGRASCPQVDWDAAAGSGSSPKTIAQPPAGEVPATADSG